MVDEQERLLPIANVGRIMKQILPPSAKISKEAKQRMQECATEFISFVTAEALERCHKENRKTVNGDDVCWALSSLGFDNYVEVIARYLHLYRVYERERTRSNFNDSNRHHLHHSQHEENDDRLRYGSKEQAQTLAPLEFKFIDEGKSSSHEPT